MSAFLELSVHLTNRYAHYLGLLERAGLAIEQRDVDAVTALQHDCASVLAEVQVDWMAFEAYLTEAPELEVSAIPAFHRLRDLIERTRARAQSNELALSLWLGELGRDRSAMRLRKASLRGYERDLHSKPRLLSTNI